MEVFPVRRIALTFLVFFTLSPERVPLIQQFRMATLEIDGGWEDRQ